eukprot:Sspe_Gene.98503::Locus_71911_Transcript_1_1_Confidence_1.000_Length_996::g.98503::m.98503/K00274/MAO, aofH; monoamine oxidase
MAALLHDVLILGAGLSGLVTLHELQGTGLDIKVLEADSRAGGRIMESDLGARWTWPDHEGMVAKLCGKLGVSLEPCHGEKGTDMYDGRHLQTGWAFGQRQFEGGTMQLIHALLRGVRDDVIEYRAVAKEISLEDGGVVVRTASGGEYRARAVVVTISPRIVARTITITPPLPEDVTDAMLGTRVWMSDATKVLFHFSRPFWSEQGLSGAAFSYGTLMQTWDNSMGGEPVIGAFASGTSEVANEEEASTVYLPSLRRAFGPVVDETIVKIQWKDWSRDKWLSP